MVRKRTNLSDTRPCASSRSSAQNAGTATRRIAPLTTIPWALLIDLTGTFVFALSGGMLAVRKHLDLIGIIMLSLVTAMAGGMLRDMMLGATPVASLVDTRYLFTALAAAAVVFVAYGQIERMDKPVMVLDAIGLGFFAVSGCSKALSYGLDPVPAILLGVMTGIGGGIVRDVLVAQVPRVLHEEVYALPALLGAGIVVLGDRFDLPAEPVAITAIVVTVTIRILSVRLGWRLPKALGSSGSSDR